MKEYTRKSLITRFIISAVIGDGFVVGFVIAMLIVGDGASFFDGNIAVLIPVFLFAIMAMPLEVMSFMLNFKKIMVGFIAPIPIISSLIEYFKGMFYAVKAFISILKKEETFTIGSRDEIES